MTSMLDLKRIFSIIPSHKLTPKHLRDHNILYIVHQYTYSVTRTKSVKTPPTSSSELSYQPINWNILTRCYRNPSKCFQYNEKPNWLGFEFEVTKCYTQNLSYTHMLHTSELNQTYSTYFQLGRISLIQNVQLVTCVVQGLIVCK